MLINEMMKENVRSNGGLKLGTLALDVPFFQASLSGYTDYTMRTLARRFGCPFAMTDVMLDKSVVHPEYLRKAGVYPGDDEHPVGAQILGKTPATMARAARQLVAIGYDAIDLNCACPVPKVLRRGRGGALLDDPDLLIDILKAVRDAVQCPVLIKLRIGMNHTPRARDCLWEIVTRSIERGVSALVIHGRTVSELYRGKADWDTLAEVKSRFPAATIIGSGDIFDPPATVELMKRTRLDGFIVARGAIGNPWIFRDLRCVWENRPVPPPPDFAEQRDIILEHFDRFIGDREERWAVNHFRKFIAYYTRRHPKRKHVLRALLAAKTRADLEAGIHTWYTEAHPMAN